MKLSAGAIIQIVFVAVVLGVLGWLGYKNHLLNQAIATAVSERDAANKALDTAADANRAQAATISQLLETQQRDSDTLISIASDVRTIKAKYAALEKDRKTLAEKNPDVKAFLNTPVPPALRRVQPATPSR